MAPKDIHILILGTCVTVLEKRVFVDVIKLRPLRWGDYHGSCGLVLNAITWILIRQKERGTCRQ